MGLGGGHISQFNRPDIVITLAAQDRLRQLADMSALTTWDKTSHLECGWALQRKKELHHGKH